MQLTGNRFTSETASFGNDLSTLPNFPPRSARQRAPCPARLLPAALRRPRHHDAGDAPDVLVAMNPAALKANLVDLPGWPAHRRLRRVLARTWPRSATRPTRSRTACSRAGRRSAPLTSMTLDALKDSGLGKKEAERSKNMFTLGLLSWMYHRPTEGTIRFLERTFRRKPEIAAANITAFRAGFNYGETTEAFAVSYEVKPPHGAWPLPEHLRQPGAGARTGRRGQRSACRSSSAPTRSPRRRTSCTSCRSTSRSASGRSRPRTRSPASARRWAPPSGRARHHDDVGPGVVLKPRPSAWPS